MKNKVKCELCEGVANMYCESDRASLCWRCDNKVHGANFLVAKHTRTVLCHHCQGLTLWTASGPILPPSMSLCLSCVTSHCQNNHTTQRSVQSQVYNHHHQDRDSHDDNDDEEEEEEDEEEVYCTDDDEEDEGENQVVPLTTLVDGVSLTASSVELSGSSSSNYEAEDEDNNSRLLTVLPPASLKRSREIFLAH
ncbi:hypothetical protein RND81_09G030100 [Saponaria officinalis]|uniref:B box-type domain-containing protein n=1 Tax=Saponaria officinalis TaxID=3572 RepID=A0AAW1II68_SAPOF